MTITPGISVQLPDGRNGTVIPSPIWRPDRVFVKVQSGRKHWFKVAECIPTRSNR
jgi:hypothetical protein